MLQFDYSFLILVVPIIGWTTAVCGLFPRLTASVKPFVAVLVAYVLYLGAVHMDPRLFGLLIATGAGMSLYDLKKDLMKTIS